MVKKLSDKVYYLIDEGCYGIGSDNGTKAAIEYFLEGIPYSRTFDIDEVDFIGWLD